MIERCDFYSAEEYLQALARQEEEARREQAETEAFAEYAREQAAQEGGQEDE